MISRPSTVWWQPLTFFSGQATRGTSSASWQQAIERLDKPTRWRSGQWHRSWWFSWVFYHVGPAADANVGWTVAVSRAVVGHTDRVWTDFGDLVPPFALSTHRPISCPCTAWQASLFSFSDPSEPRDGDDGGRSGHAEVRG